MSKSPLRYFHGGPAGLHNGTFILPPDITGAPSTASFGGRGVCRTDRVYVIADFTQAYIYAGMHPSRRGVVYEVEPYGVLVDDADHRDRDVSFHCAKAKIIRRFRLSGKQRRLVQKAMATP